MFRFTIQYFPEEVKEYDEYEHKNKENSYGFAYGSAYLCGNHDN